MLDSEYEPGPEDYRITLKAFGDEGERRVLAFVGSSQVNPGGDRDLTAEKLEEDQGKDVTSCVDFDGNLYCKSLRGVQGGPSVLMVWLSFSI